MNIGAAVYGSPNVYLLKSLIRKLEDRKRDKVRDSQKSEVRNP